MIFLAAVDMQTAANASFKKQSRSFTWTLSGLFQGCHIVPETPRRGSFGICLESGVIGCVRSSDNQEHSISDEHLSTCSSLETLHLYCLPPISIHSPSCENDISSISWIVILCVK